MKIALRALLVIAHLMVVVLLLTYAVRYLNIGCPQGDTGRNCGRSGLLALIPDLPWVGQPATR